MVTRPARTHCAGPSTTDCQPNYPRYPIHAHPVPDTRPTGTKNRTRSADQETGRPAFYDNAIPTEYQHNIGIRKGPMR